MTGTFGKRVNALLATARVANVPSVVSNVWVGAMVFELQKWWLRAEFLWVAVAGVSLYVAGNFLNDWYDREWDAKNRPERGLPGGLFSPETYLVVAVGLVVLALVCSWMVSAVAFGIAGLILLFVIAYTVLHKRTAWGVVWIGLCRALLVALGIAGMIGKNGDADWSLVSFIAILFGIPLFCYIVGLSLSARFEAKNKAPRWAAVVSLGMLALPILLVCGGFVISTKTVPLLWGVVPYAGWMVACYVRRRHIPSYVAGLLAGIPLVDLMILSANALYVAGFGYTVSYEVYLVPLVAFALGLLLQRVAPAS